MTSAWDGEELTTLRTEWAKGTSITQIGKMIGRTRNAVAGQANRSGLPKRPSPIKRGCGICGKPSGACLMCAGS